MATTKIRGATATYACKCCGAPFIARTADRARGWARYCSKSCKAAKQEMRTGQHAAYQERREQGEGTEGGLCFPSHAEGEVQ